MQRCLLTHSPFLDREFFCGFLQLMHVCVCSYKRPLRLLQMGFKTSAAPKGAASSLFLQRLSINQWSWRISLHFCVYRNGVFFYHSSLM